MAFGSLRKAMDLHDRIEPILFPLQDDWYGLFCWYGIWWTCRPCTCRANTIFQNGPNINPINIPATACLLPEKRRHDHQLVIGGQILVIHFFRKVSGLTVSNRKYLISGCNRHLYFSQRNDAFWNIEKSFPGHLLRRKYL